MPRKKKTETVSFFDLKTRRKVRVPIEETSIITRKNPRTKRKIEMRTAKRGGRKLFRIVKG